MLQFIHAAQNGMVLNSGGDNVFSTLAEALNGAENGPVVGFCAAGGEKNPVGFGTHGGSDLHSGAAKLMGGVDAEGVQCTGVAPILR